MYAQTQRLAFSNHLHRSDSSSASKSGQRDKDTRLVEPPEEMYKLKHSKLVREGKPNDTEAPLHHRHTDRFPTPPHKGPRWKRIHTPPIRSPQFRRIRQSPLANVKGHFKHLRHHSRERNLRKNIKHKPLIPPYLKATRIRPFLGHRQRTVLIRKFHGRFHIPSKATIRGNATDAKVCQEPRTRGGLRQPP